MARKYYGSFYSVTNQLHRVEIWDAPTVGDINWENNTTNWENNNFNWNFGASGTELILAGDGYEIQRDGEGDTFYTNPIRSSRSTSFWVMPNNTVLAEFKAIATNTEQHWAVLIYKNNELQHVGKVLADQITFKREAIQAKPVISLAAVDGLELLKGFNVSADWFTDGKLQVSQLFRRCLDLLGLKDYWVVNGTTSDYLRDAVSPYSSDALRKGIDLLQVDVNTFVSDYDQFKDIKATDISAFQYASNNMVSCYEALQQICDILQARFVHELGKYWLVSAAEYLDSTVSYRQYSYTLQYIGASTYVHAVSLAADVRPQWLAKPTLSYQPAAKYVQVDTERTLGVTAFRTFGNQSAGTFTRQFTGIPTGSTPDEAPLRVRFAIKFGRHTFTPLGNEDASAVGIKIWLTDGSGNIRILNNTNFYWVSAATVPVRTEFIKTDLQSSTWTSFVFDKQLSSAPAGFTNLNVQVVYVYAVKYKYNILGIKTGDLAEYAKPYWGSIQVAFADASPYQNPDFTFNITEVYNPDSGSSVNSTPIILKPKYYYSSSKYAIGNIEANNGTAWVIADDWYSGYDSVTHGSPTEMLGKSIAGLYKDFVPTIQGTWVDAGTLNAVKSLFFDEYKWLLNGAVYNARAEQWAGEWLGLLPVYTGLTSTGEGLKIGQGVKDRVNYMDQQIGRLNDSVQRTPALVLSHLVNESEGAPTADLTINTMYEVMVHYTAATEQMAWHLQEHNASVVYTVGTHTITNGYELIIGNSTDGNVIINLPAADLSKGKKYYFMKTANAHVVTISGGAFNINGSTATTINQLYGSKTLISNGVQWYIIASV